MDRRAFLNLGGLGLARSLEARGERRGLSEPSLTDSERHDWLLYVETSRDFVALRTVAIVDSMAAEFLAGACELFFSAPAEYPERDTKLRVPVPEASTVLQVCGEVQSTSGLQYWRADGRTWMVVNFLEPATVTIYVPQKPYLGIVAVARRPQ